MSRPLEEQSLVELLTGLATGIPKLFRDELDLLKGELALALARLQAASALLVVAAAFMAAAIMLAMAAAVGGLAILLIGAGLPVSAAVTLASLAAALFGLVLAAGFALAARGELHRARTAVDAGVAALRGRDPAIEED